MTDLVTISRQQIRELTQAMPTEKRAAWGKACEAAVKHLKASRKDYDKAFEIASCMVRNSWHLGVALGQLELNPGARAGKRAPPGERVSLSELGINHNYSSRCQQLAQKYEAVQLDEYLDSVYDETTYRLPAVKPTLTDSSGVHVAENSGENEWYTPPEFIESARETMGSIDLDPASSDKAQETVQACKFYSLADDGLHQEWSGNVWMNPPYNTDLIVGFMAKLVSHVTSGDVTHAITLTNNSTETTWFQAAAGICTAVCFPKTRIKFVDEKGNPGAPLQGQVFMYFGRRKSAFRNEFAKHGLVFGRAV